MRIKLNDLTDEGVRIKTGKTKKSILISWTDELKEAVNQAKEIKRKVGPIYLFATRTGQCYAKLNGTTSGFDSVWQRRMKKFISDDGINFHEHYIC